MLVAEMFFSPLAARPAHLRLHVGMVKLTLKGTPQKTNMAVENPTIWRCISYPLPSMYGIFTYIYHILPLRTTKCR